MDEGTAAEGQLVAALGFVVIERFHGPLRLGGGETGRKEGQLDDRGSRGKQDPLGSQRRQRPELLRHLLVRVGIAWEPNTCSPPGSGLKTSSTRRKTKLSTQSLRLIHTRHLRAAVLNGSPRSSDTIV